MPLVYAMHMHTAGGGVPSEDGAFSQRAVSAKLTQTLLKERCHSSRL